MIYMVIQHAFAGAATLKTCADPALALPDGLEEVKKRVVRVEHITGSGSGSIISPDGFVLTAAHVLGGAEKVTVVLADESKHPGQVIAIDANADVALVRMEATGLPCLPLANDAAPTGADLFLMGSPSGKIFTHSVTKGIVSGARDHDGVEVLQTDASLSPGYSGGPVLSLDGRIQGVISFKVIGQAIDGIGFATTSTASRKALDLSFGDMTELDRSALPQQARTPSIRFDATIEITDRPDHIAGPLGRPPCHRLDFRESKDPFNDKSRAVGRGKDLFSYKVGDGMEPTLTLYAPFSVFYDEGEDMQPRVDIKLLDGTKIALTAARPPEVQLGSFFTPTVAVDFPLTEELVATLASSGPVVQRWTYGDNVIDQDRSERQRVKYFRPHFSCLLPHLEP